jgi:uncharacterized protein YcnI
MTSRLGRLASATALTIIVVLAGAAPALAHIDPDPAEAPAGSEQRIGFTVEHGCDTSPTIQIDMRIPEGATEVRPEPPAGWTGDIVDDVVTFAGGPLAADVEGTFTIVATLPLTPDVTIYFPIVQRCEQGEIRWIDIPSDGSGDDLDEPAPAMLLTAPLATTTIATTTIATTTTIAATTTTIAPTTTIAATTTTPPSSTTSTTSTTAATTTVAASTTSVPTTAPDDSDGGDSTGAIVIAAAIGGLALVVAGFVVWQIRRRQ